MKKKINIYVATHKMAQFPDNKLYKPIQVGAKGKEKFTKITDDSGKNISLKKVKKKVCLNLEVQLLSC